MSHHRKKWLAGGICAIALVGFLVVSLPFADQTGTGQDHRKETTSKDFGRPEGRPNGNSADRAKMLNSLPQRVRLLMQIESGEISIEDAWLEANNSGFPFHERASLMGNLLRKIVATEGSSSALAFLNSRVGPGVLRNQLFHAVFSSAALNLDQAAATLRQLEFPDEELEIALDAIASSYVVHDLGSFQPREVFGKLPPEAIPSLAQSVFDSWKRGVSKPDSDIHTESLKMLDEIDRLDIDEATKDKAIDGLLRSLSSVYPDDAWEVIVGSVKFDGKVSGSTRELLVSHLVQENPEDAFDKILSYNGNAKGSMIEHAVTHLALTDSARFNHVLESRQDLTSNPINNDSVALGMIDFAIAHSDRNAAEKWLETISNPNQKTRGTDLISRGFPNK